MSHSVCGAVAAALTVCRAGNLSHNRCRRVVCVLNGPANRAQETGFGRFQRFAINTAVPDRRVHLIAVRHSMLVCV